MITLEKVERKASKSKRFLNWKKLVLRMNFGVKFWVYLEKLTTLSLIKQTFIKIKHSLEYIVNQSKFSIETIIIISSTKTKEYLRKKRGGTVKWGELGWMQAPYNVWQLLGSSLGSGNKKKKGEDFNPSFIAHQGALDRDFKNNYITGCVARFRCFGGESNVLRPGSHLSPHLII